MIKILQDLKELTLLIKLNDHYLLFMIFILYNQILFKSKVKI